VAADAGIAASTATAFDLEDLKMASPTVPARSNGEQLLAQRMTAGFTVVEVQETSC
jgi:hypothetical protein